MVRAHCEEFRSADHELCSFAFAGLVESIEELPWACWNVGCGIGECMESVSVWTGVGDVRQICAYDISY